MREKECEKKAHTRIRTSTHAHTHTFTHTHTQYRTVAASQPIAYTSGLVCCCIHACSFHTWLDFARRRSKCKWVRDCPLFFFFFFRGLVIRARAVQGPHRYQGACGCAKRFGSYRPPDLDPSENNRAGDQGRKPLGFASSRETYTGIR